MTSRFVLPFADVGSGIKPSDGAQLFFFKTGTNTPKDTHSDSAASIPNSNPVIADSVGVFPDIYITGGYWITLKNKNGSQIFGEVPIDEFMTGSEVGRNIGGFATYEFDTAAKAKTGETIGGGFVTLKVKDVIKIKQRANSSFDVISGTGTANELDIIADGTLDLSFTIRLTNPVTPTMLGALTSKSDNSAEIQKAYNLASENKLTFSFDQLWPTTETVDFSLINSVVIGNSRGKWRDIDTDKPVSGIIYTGLLTPITCGVGSQYWAQFKVRSSDKLNTDGVDFNGVQASLMCLINLRIQNHGDAGINLNGDNAGESFFIHRVESSGNGGSGLFLNRTDTTCNNMVLSKVNFHRNDADGCNFSSGVQKLTISNGCDITLNAIAGVAFRSSVDFDSVIENNWFENNDTDILIDGDIPTRGVTSRNNKLGEATTQAIYCKNGRIKSYGDKFNNTPIGVKFDVSDGNSVVQPGSVTSVTDFYSGDTSNLYHRPFEGCSFEKKPFSVTNVPAAATGQLIPVNGQVGHNIARINPKSLFYKIRASIDGVTVTTGSMTINIFKNAGTNPLLTLSLVIDSTNNGVIEDLELFGTNVFSIDNNFNNFFLRYDTTADWDGTTGTIDFDVFVIDQDTGL